MEAEGKVSKGGPRLASGGGGPRLAGGGGGGGEG